MILTQRRRKASKLASQDVISNMPDNVVTAILDRLPLQDAVRTGILSRDWRSKWTTMLSQLVFDEKFYDYIYSKKVMLLAYIKHELIISRLLLDVKGPITKFVLFVEDDDFDFKDWILVLSQKGVKDVTIINGSNVVIELPDHFFSCLEFKHLNLDSCNIDLPDSFHGFPNLLSLELHNVQFESGDFLKFVNNCPALESLSMAYTYHPIVELFEFSKLINLKFLTFLRCNIDETMITSTGSIFEFVSCLPKLEELELDFAICKPLIEDEALKGSPTNFLCLKTLKLSNIDSGSGIMLSFAFEMIRSSPSLQTLEITAKKHSFIEDCATKRLPTAFPSLKTIKFSNLSSGFMLDVIKCSPHLQTLEITVGDLSIDDCDTERSPTIFPYLKTIKFSNFRYGFMLSIAIDIIRSSPNLQALEITAGGWSYTDDGTRKWLPITFPYLKTLKLSNFGYGFMLSIAIDIIRSSPNLQTLEIKANDRSSTKGGTGKRSHISLPCLKTLILSNIDLGDHNMVSFAFELMKSSHNLQTLEITAGDWCSTEDDAIERSRTTFPCLKTLKLYNINLGSCIMLSSAFEIISSSPNLQTLEIKAGDRCSIEEGARKRPRTTFPCLKTLKLYNINLGDCIMLSLAFEIISSSLSLQTLEIAAGDWRVDPQLAICYPKIDCNKIGLTQLQNVILTDLRASNNELSLIKYLLACSPFLKKVVIRPHLIVKTEDKFMFSRKLLKHRASTTAEIKFY